jgi:hypothetical protein
MDFFNNLLERWGTLSVPRGNRSALGYVNRVARCYWNATRASRCAGQSACVCDGDAYH